MGTIGFVILNYKAYEEAAACAASILKTLSRHSDRDCRQRFGK